jgi:hypothetical protein
MGPIDAALSELGTVTRVGCRYQTGRRCKDEKEDSMRSRLLTCTKEMSQVFRMKDARERIDQRHPCVPDAALESAPRPRRPF